MAGDDAGMKLVAMPLGKWKGTKWSAIPDASLRALREWWSSSEPKDTPIRQAIVKALSDEAERRETRQTRCWRELPANDGRHRSMIVTKNRSRPSRKWRSG